MELPNAYFEALSLVAEAKDMELDFKDIPVHGSTRIYLDDLEREGYLMISVFGERKRYSFRPEGRKKYLFEKDARDKDAKEDAYRRAKDRSESWRSWAQTIVQALVSFAIFFGGLAVQFCFHLLG